MKTTRLSAALALAVCLVGASNGSAATTSVNSGSLGAAGNGSNADAVTLNNPGALAAAGDLSAGYAGGANTTIPHNSALNPASGSPFTIEFWTKPTELVNDSLGPSPVFNRVTASPRSGWVFFQRSPSTGFNFLMYNGDGSNAAKNITGGAYSLNAWNHVVVTWDGSNPTMYVNGVNAAAVVTGTPSGIYNASNAATFSIGAYDTGSNPFTGFVDETAFYATALTPAQILAHYNAASNPTAGVYSGLVQADGAIVYLQNVPEPTTGALALLGLAATLRRRRA